MAAKKTVRSVMRKQAGPKAADALLQRVDKMAKAGAKASEIEKALHEVLAKYITDEVMEQSIPIIKARVTKAAEQAIITCMKIVKTGPRKR